MDGFAQSPLLPFTKSDYYTQKSQPYIVTTTGASSSSSRSKHVKSHWNLTVSLSWNRFALDLSLPSTVSLSCSVLNKMRRLWYTKLLPATMSTRKSSCISNNWASMADRNVSYTALHLDIASSQEHRSTKSRFQWSKASKLCPTRKLTYANCISPTISTGLEEEEKQIFWTLKCWHFLGVGVMERYCSKLLCHHFRETVLSIFRTKWLTTDLAPIFTPCNTLA